MSYTELLIVPESGEMVGAVEFINGHGSAPRIWRSIQEKYMPGRPWITHTQEESRLFWKLVDDERLTECERIAFAFTFDHVICERQKAGELAGLLREFDAQHLCELGYVNHLPAIALALERHAEDEAIGFAFIQTSVSDDVWDLSDTCLSVFHDSANADENAESYCLDCGNGFSDRSFSRRFDWSRDKDKGIHFMLFENYGSRPAAALPVPEDQE